MKLFRFAAAIALLFSVTTFVGCGPDTSTQVIDPGEDTSSVDDSSYEDAMNEAAKTQEN